MQIKYLGHASFLIKSKDAKLVTDPFDAKAVGMKFPKQDADIVTISHGHEDHNNVGGVSEDALVIDWPGEFEKKGIRVKGVATYHDEKKGVERGSNVVYKITADDVNILHCGDLGHVLTEEFIEQIGDIDILLIPVGGHYTISAQQAVEIIKKIDPYIVVPMHYNQPALDQKTFGSLTDLNAFIKAYGIEKPETVDQLTVKKEDLSEEETKVVVMNIS